MGRVSKSLSYSVLLLLLAFSTEEVESQAVNADTLQHKITINDNYVYMPVLSFSYGVLSYYGEVQDSYSTSAIGNTGAMLKVATFVDRRHLFVSSFSVMRGQLGGNSYSHTDLPRNLNFKTDLLSFELDLEYRFGHFFPANSLVTPYISVGFSTLSFSSKGDLLDADGLSYHYWSDGTIRDVDESAAGPSRMLYRDYKYETDLRWKEQEDFGLGNYSQQAFAVPVGLGAYFRIDRRAFLSVGVSYHYTFTDLLDNVASSGTSIKGIKGNDSYLYTHVGLHFDLFSHPRPDPNEPIHMDSDLDALFFGDEDEDLVLDLRDLCPMTGTGIAVDTLGCPLDGDMDGVPDYLDLEPGTAPDAWVDEDGVTVTDEQFLLVMQQRNSAMLREDVEDYLFLIQPEYRFGSSLELPEKYKQLDMDGDGYISFEELLRTIDQYFDFQLDMSLDELRQLYEFFFSQ